MALTPDEKRIARVAVVGVILIIIGALALGSIRIVPAGHRGVMLTWGKPSMEVLEEGLHFKIPIAQSIVKMEVRTLKLEVDADSASKDLQDVKTTMALNYHIDPMTVPVLYKDIGLTYRQRIIDPAIQESVKAVSAQYTAEELITKRASVRTEINSFLRERLTKYNIVVDDFNIVNFQFSEEFDRAIEQKVTAEQLKLKAERDLERIKIEKEQIIATAQAQAESLRLQKQEVTDDLIKLRQIENQKLSIEVQAQAVEKWNGVLPTFVGGGAIPFIDISNFQNG